MLLILSTTSFAGCKKEKKKANHNDLFPNADTEYFTPFQNEKTSYCSLDEGLDLPVYTQGMSGCFAFSAVTSVQAYLQKNKIGNWEATGEEIVDRMYCAKEDMSSGKDGMYATIGNKSEYGGSPLHVFDVLCSDPLHGYVLSDAKRLLNPKIDELKEWVREYGAPVVAISLESGYSRSHGYPTQNYKGTETNHFLCVIGWDDDFPADAFSTKASRNGAWLVQNTITPLNTPAYYWVSYDVQFPLAISYQMTNSYSSGENHGSALIGALAPVKALMPALSGTKGNSLQSGSSRKKSPAPMRWRSWTVNSDSRLPRSAGRWREPDITWLHLIHLFLSRNALSL